MGKKNLPALSKDGNQLELIAPYVHRNGLKLPTDFAYDKWEELGKSIRLAGKSVMWWLGDWIVFGESHFKDKAIQVADMTGYDPSTLQNAASVCRHIPLKNRTGLSFEHHKEVAGLAEKEQDRWLTKAVNNHWTRADLRGAIKDAGLRKKDREKPAKAAKRKKGKKRKVTVPSVTNWGDLQKHLSATLLVTEPWIKMQAAIYDILAGDKLPTSKQLEMMKKVSEELRGSLYDVLADLETLLDTEALQAA